jgi:sugar O-acyltransferase (sialic acid O-acetyltransferase NeuD family)
MKTPGQQGGIPVVVLGAGGTGLLMAHCLASAPGCTFAGFLDDDDQKKASGYEGWPVLGGLASWLQLDAGVKFLSSLYGARCMGDYAGRVEALRIPVDRWMMFADPRAVVFPDVQVGPGCFVGPGCVVEPGVQLGARCVLLGNVYVAHHACLGDDVACANSASIAGGVQIGARTFIGANATVREYVQIGADAVVGMGAVVVKSVPGHGIVAGNPARPL